MRLFETENFDLFKNERTYIVSVLECFPANKAQERRYGSGQVSRRSIPIYMHRASDMLVVWHG